MTAEQYEMCKPYAPIAALFFRSGEYVGGADGLFNIIEREFNSGQIDRSCNDCRAGFLRFIHTEIARYETSLIQTENAST